MKPRPRVATARFYGYQLSHCSPDCHPCATCGKLVLACELHWAGKQLHFHLGCLAEHINKMEGQNEPT